MSLARLPATLFGGRIKQNLFAVTNHCILSFSLKTRMLRLQQTRILCNSYVERKLN